MDCPVGVISNLNKQVKKGKQSYTPIKTAWLPSEGKQTAVVTDTSVHLHRFDARSHVTDVYEFQISRHFLSTETNKTNRDLFEKVEMLIFFHHRSLDGLDSLTCLN